MNNLYRILLLIGVVISAVKCVDENIVEPCKDSSNITRCLQDYFSRNAECVVPQYTDDTPINFTGTHYAYAPSIYLTVVLKNTSLSHFDGRIETFYKDTDNGNLVLTVAFDGLYLNSSVTDLVVSQRGKQPKNITEYASGVYPVALTAVISTKNGITKDVILSTRFTADHPLVAVKFFYIGPKFTLNLDPVIASTTVALLANLNNVVKELFLTGARYFFIAYLQKYICDFGIPYQVLESVK